MSKSAIYITRSAYNRIGAIVRASDLEVSMLAEVEIVNKNIVITEIHIPKQTRAAAFTKIVHDGIIDLIETGVDPSKIKCWIHSHVNMGVSPSGQDVKQAEELMKDSDWFMRGIFNKKGEYSLSLHWNNLIVECELHIIDEQTDDIEALKQEIKEKTVFDTTTTGTVNYGYRNWNNAALMEDEDEYYNYLTQKTTSKKKKLSYEEFKEKYDINVDLATINRDWIKYLSSYQK